MALVWEKRSSGTVAKLGKLDVIRVYTNIPARGEQSLFCIWCSLPGMKEDFGKFLEEVDAKSHAEEIFKFWLEQTGLIDPTAGISFIMDSGNGVDCPDICVDGCATIPTHHRRNRPVITPVQTEPKSQSRRTRR